MWRKSAGVVGAVALLTLGVMAPAVAADPPDLVAVLSNNTIKQGFQKNFLIEITGFEDGGTFAMSGEGIELIIPHGGIKPAANPDQLRLKFEAADDAPLGLRDLIVINPDGQTDTLVGAIEVIASGEVPQTGVTGHVFADTNGDGIKDAGEGGLASVSVSVTDSAGLVVATTTDSNGDYTVTGIAGGDTTVTYATPVDHVLTTANDVQVVTVVVETTASAADVGYEPPFVEPGAVEILGFGNANANISQGETRSYRVNVTGADAAAVWSVSGDDVVVTRAVLRGDAVSLTIAADVTAALGLRDVTVVNPDGSTDTLVDGLEVVGS